MHADDTIIYYFHKSITEIKQKVNIDSSNLISWFYENQLIINIMKGEKELLLFQTLKRLNNFVDRKLDIQHDGLKVTNKSFYKYLGLHL